MFAPGRDKNDGKAVALPVQPSLPGWQKQMCKQKTVPVLMTEVMLIRKVTVQKKKADKKAKKKTWGPNVHIEEESNSSQEHLDFYRLWLNFTVGQTDQRRASTCNAGGKIFLNQIRSCVRTTTKKTMQRRILVPKLTAYAVPGSGQLMMKPDDS